MSVDGLDRRAFVARLAGLASLPQVVTASAGAWRTFEVVTEVDLGEDDSPARLWLPLPLDDAPYQRTSSLRLDTTAQRHWVTSHPDYRLRVQCCAWAAVRGPRRATLTMVVATRDRTGATAPVAAADAGELVPYLKATRLLPTTGIVRDTAEAIVRGVRGDEARARRLYDWIVDNTFRDPAVEGCGLGDIRWMLETKNLGGKCADLNALFVGMARSLGLAARDVYGLRVGPSAVFRSLGRQGDVTTAQHCRAEVHLSGVGWVPVDPADVRKVVLEERPGMPLALDDPRVRRARAAGFGGWEMNWIAFNDAHDVALAEASSGPLPFFMYPQAEVAGQPRSGVHPETFRYSIAARLLPGA